MPLSNYVNLIRNEVERRSKLNIKKDICIRSIPADTSDEPRTEKKLNSRIQIDAIPIQEFLNSIYVKERGIDTFSRRDINDRLAWLNMVIARTFKLYKGRSDYIFDKLTLFIIREGLSIGECMGMIDLNSGYRWFITKLITNNQKFYYARFTPLEANREFPDITILHNSAMNTLQERYHNAVAFADGSQRKKLMMTQEIEKFNTSRSKLLKITRWFNDTIDCFRSKKIHRNRHLWIYGAGSNGKTSFVNWMRRNFKCQLLTACDKYLLT